MTYEGEERRSETCSMHQQIKDTMSDFYRFKEDQISRNTACDLQLGQHEKNIDGLKAHMMNCGEKTIPTLRKAHNKIFGMFAVLGLLFTLLLIGASNISAKSEQNTKEVQQARSDVQSIKTDLRYIKRDISDMRGDMKEFIKTMQQYIDMDNKRDAHHD